MRYVDRTFTLPASPKITQEAWDAIWRKPAADHPPETRKISDAVLRREYIKLWEKRSGRKFHTGAEDSKEPDIVYVCSSTTIHDYEGAVSSPNRDTENQDELPPQDLPLDPLTPVRIGLPGGCF